MIKVVGTARNTFCKCAIENPDRERHEARLDGPVQSVGWGRERKRMSVHEEVAKQHIRLAKPRIFSNFRI